MKRSMPIVAAALAAALLPACSSVAVQAADDAPLPFHVALIPVRPETAELRPPEPPAPPPDPDGPPDRRPPPPPLEIEVSPEMATRACAEALEERSFVRVTTLEYPAGLDGESFAAQLTREEQDAHWVDAARAAGADLVLRCGLRYDPRVASDTNGLFVPNLALFLLGGPFCYFLDDRDYDVRAELDGEFFDVAPSVRAKELAAGRPGQPPPRLDRSEALLDPRLKSRRYPLDFVDRSAGASPVFWVTSLVVPAGLLCQRAGRVREEVTEALIAQLFADLAGEIATKNERLLAPEGRTPITLDPEPGFRAVRRGDGEVEVEGVVVLHPRDGVDRLHAWSVQAGGEVARGRAPEPVADGDALRYRLAARVACAADAQHVTLTVTDATRFRNARTFSFPIEGAPR